MTTEQNNKTLVLFTSAFPFGKGEQFIETEIVFLCNAFKEVHIYPLDWSGAARPLPANAVVKQLKLYDAYSRAKLLLRRAFTLFGLYRKQQKLTRHPDKYKGRCRQQFSYLMHRVADAEKLGTRLAEYDPQKTVLYSYWFNVWTTALIFSKHLGYHPMNIRTRAHGGDLDEQQRKSGYFPFRSLEMSMIDSVITVSEYGRQLLAKQYPQQARKITVSRLGVTDYGDNPFAPAPVFRVVTCSFVYGLKRLHLVAEILEQLKFPVEWVHFGEGELLEELKARAAKLPPHITTVFRGLVPNTEVLEYYRTNQVDYFMNVSELEGIPVSIMEAISFGIPVTGCNICGVPEIVTEQTGLLFEKDFSTADAAARLTAYQAIGHERKVEFRRGVKLFWEENFRAEKNYSVFIYDHLSS
ncbi:MAG TPA: glycosyltransferase [Bacteroidia bacterium]|nr:glycosyltransferase [Bacteroidia bacterium]